MLHSCYNQKKGVVAVMLRLRVKEVAEAKGVSMTKLSHRSEVAFNTIRAIFRDPYRSITTDTLQRLADALDVSPLDLVEVVPDEQEKL
jgi:DNA-binding Xre family transcriptional regulator